MLTRHRAQHLAQAAMAFPILGPLSADNLLELVALELGDAERLDRFCPNGTHSKAWSRAIPRSPLLHIVSGNTPHAGLQSIIRGLLVGAHNRCKLPSGGLPEVTRFRELLPEEMAAQLELSETLPEQWLSEAEAVIVFGSDETLAHFRQQLRPEQRLIEHGHRLSFGVIFSNGGHQRDNLQDGLRRVARAAARDASLYDQQGCLSPHLFYLPASLLPAFGPLMAEEMAAFQREVPRSALTPGEERDIMAAREEAAFRAAIDPQVRLWSSEGDAAWTVIAQPSSRFIPSCLNRVVRLIPLADAGFLPALKQGVASVRAYLSTIGLFPCTMENAEALLPLGASRIAPLGEMQFPGPLWHHDGDPVLLPLVRWVDYEAPSSFPIPL